MSTHRTLHAALVTLALLLGVALPALADLEVTIPPGTAHEWWRELPDRVPRLRGPAPAKKEEKKEEPKPEETKPEGKGTQEKKKKKEPPKETDRKDPAKTEVRSQPEFVSTDHRPLIFCGVLTVDLPIHCGWVKREGELVPRQYPPTITDDIYWNAQVGFLRRLCHPSLCPESEAFWYLVLQGDAAREVAKAAKGERFLADFAKAVSDMIPELPKEAPPALEGGDSDEEKMLRKLAKEDLGTGDPYSLDPTYAGRLLSLGEAGFPSLLAAAASPHPLLRRNAAVLLGSYPMPEADEALRKMFKEDKDPTVRTRALFHLARHRDATIVPDLVTMLGSSEKYQPELAAFALGMIGTKECVQPLVDALGKRGDDWDFLVAVTPALARCGSADEKAGAIPALRKLEESLRAAEPRFKEDQSIPRPGADIPDRPEVKNRMLLELATIALARLGDKEGTKRLTALVTGGYEDKEHPVGHANASGPQRADQSENMKFVCPSSYELLVETWVAQGKEGVPYLQSLVMNQKSSEKIRLFALKAPELAKDKKFVGAVALNADSEAVRAQAMRQLTSLDEPNAIKLANGVVGAYASGKPLNPRDGKGDVTVVAALEILHHAKKLKVDTIKPCLQRALSEWVYEKPDITPEGVKPFKFSPPIIDTLCDELASLGDKNGAPLLKAVAKDNRLTMRAEAARALRFIPGDEATKVLVELLDDEDGWLRYNAYLALRDKTGEDHFADWIYGSKDDRKSAQDAYKALVSKKK